MMRSKHSKLSIGISVLLLCCFLLSGLAVKSQWTIQNVPDPKSSGSSYVSNPDAILTYDEEYLLNSSISMLEDTTTAQIAVVVLNSIGDEVPKEFATDLFNFWQIGDQQMDNGLLILFVLDQRRIEFETGYGVEGILPDIICYRIQQDYMVPKFKEGKYGEGMIEGVQQVVDICIKGESEIKNTDPEIKESESPGLIALLIYSSLVLVFCLFFGIMFFISLFQKNYYKRYNTIRVFKLYFWFIIAPLPFVFIYLFSKKMLEKWRNTPRISARTGKIMRKLSEEEDDEYLSSGQLTEEIVKSIDYDVWIGDEEDDVLIQAYKRWYSDYSSCPKCKSLTFHKLYDKIKKTATYSSSGLGEKKHECAHCKHSKVVTYRIPKKTKSSTSSSRSFSSGGGSSSWGGGSSSWGGGSSGGGGAGSSW